MGDTVVDKKQKKKNGKKKNIPLFVTSILLMIGSIYEILACVLVLFLAVVGYIIGYLKIDLNFYTALLGVLTVFSIVVIVASFYASIKGITQSSLIKCKKLGVFLIPVSVVSVAVYIINGLYNNGANDTLSVFGIIFNLIMYLVIPILYFLFASSALKKDSPKSKYESIIDSI